VVDFSTLVDLQRRTHGPRLMPDVLVVPRDRRSTLSVADDVRYCRQTLSASHFNGADTQGWSVDLISITISIPCSRKNLRESPEESPILTEPQNLPYIGLYRTSFLRLFVIQMHIFAVRYSQNSTWLVKSRHDTTTRSTCRANAFWLCRACRTARLDKLDMTSSTGATRNLVCCVICIIPEDREAVDLVGLRERRTTAPR